MRGTSWKSVLPDMVIILIIIGLTFLFADPIFHFIESVSAGRYEGLQPILGEPGDTEYLGPSYWDYYYCCFDFNGNPTDTCASYFDCTYGGYGPFNDVDCDNECDSSIQIISFVCCSPCHCDRHPGPMWDTGDCTSDCVNNGDLCYSDQPNAQTKPCIPKTTTVAWEEGRTCSDYPNTAMHKPRYCDDTTSNDEIACKNKCEEQGYEYLGYEPTYHNACHCRLPAGPPPPAASFIHYLGDINYDCVIDQTDADRLTAAWSSQPGDPNWDPDCDISPVGGDDLIDMSDISMFAAHNGLTCATATCANVGGTPVPNNPDCIASGGTSCIETADTTSIPGCCCLGI